MHCHIYSCKRLFMAFFLNKTGCPTDITEKSCVRRLGWVRMIGLMKKVKRKRWNCF